MSLAVSSSSILKWFAPLAQLVEQLPYKRQVAGSNPAWSTKRFALVIVRCEC